MCMCLILLALKGPMGYSAVLWLYRTCRNRGYTELTLTKENTMR